MTLAALLKEEQQRAKNHAELIARYGLRAERGWTVPAVQETDEAHTKLFDTLVRLNWRLR